MFLSNITSILKGRSSNTHFKMFNEPLGLAARRSFERRDRTKKDWSMKLVLNEKQKWRCFGLRTWKICGPSMTKPRRCCSKKTFHLYKVLGNIKIIANRIVQWKRGRQKLEKDPISSGSIPTDTSFIFNVGLWKKEPGVSFLKSLNKIVGEMISPIAQ